MAEGLVDRGSLCRGAAGLAVSLSDAQVDAMLAFAALLERWNRAFNLVSRQDLDRLLPRHLLDSLSAVALLQGPRVLDLGTGAGLPGVPLAIVRNDLRFTLLDRNSRKIRFIGQVVRSLGLDNVVAQCADAAGLEPAARFETVVSRAVTAPAAAWRLAEPRLCTGGRVVLWHRGQSPQPRDGAASCAATGAGAGPPGAEGAAARQPAAAPAEPGAPASFPSLPPGARLLERRLVDIPGLSWPHELLVLGREAA